MNTITRQIVRLILSGLFLIAMVFFNPFLQRQFLLYQYATALTVILLVIAITIAAIQLFKMIVMVLAAGRNPSPWIEKLNVLGLIIGIQVLSKEHLSQQTRRIFHYGSWGMIVFIFVFILNTLEVFSSKLDFFLSTNWLGEKYEQNAPEEVPVARLLLFSEDNNIKNYAEDLLVISKDLKHAGAKVVVARVPIGRMGVPKNSDRVNELFHEIDSLGFVVLAVRPNSLYRPRTFQTYIEDQTRIVYSAQPSDPKMSSQSFNEIIPWYPLQQFPLGKKMYSEIDVSLAAAKKYFGIPDTVKPVREGNEVVMGKIRIPVTAKGKALADDYFLQIPFLPVTAYRGIYGNGMTINDNDTVAYWEDVYAPNAKYSRSEQGVKIENLDRYRQYFENKVVIINWYNSSEQPNSFPFDGFSVGSVISSVLLDKHYTTNRWMFNSLLIILIALIGATVNKFKTVVSIFFTSFLCIVITVIGIWAFFEYRIIIEVLYLYVAMAMAYIVFSLVKMARMNIDTNAVI